MPSPLLMPSTSREGVSIRAAPGIGSSWWLMNKLLSRIPDPSAFDKAKVEEKKRRAGRRALRRSQGRGRLAPREAGIAGGAVQPRPRGSSRRLDDKPVSLCNAGGCRASSRPALRSS